VPWLAGSRINIVDGNCLAASEHRIKELREAQGRALPGTAVVVYTPAQGLVTDVLPCENGHTQERALFGPLLKTVEAGDLWMEDRNFCTRAFLCDITTRGACFITRAHRGLTFEMVQRSTRAAARRRAAWLNSGSQWGISKAKRMSFGACASS
jgi:hypothetical protein